MEAIPRRIDEDGEARGAAPSGRTSAPTREMLQTVRSLNRDLERRGAEFRIPVPFDVPRDRDAVSTALLAAFAATDDRRAFDLLYRLNESFVRILCHARLRRAPRLVDVDDLVHDAFVTVHRRAHRFRFDERATFTGWVTRMVENLLIGHLRRARHRPVAGILEDVADRAHGPLGRVILDETRERVTANWPILVRVCAAALLQLPPQMRRVVELREGEDLSYLEIANRLGVARGTAAMLLRRARLRILRVMNRSLAPPGPRRRGRGD